MKAEGSMYFLQAG